MKLNRRGFVYNMDTFEDCICKMIETVRNVRFFFYLFSSFSFASILHTNEGKLPSLPTVRLIYFVVGSGDGCTRLPLLRGDRYS